MSLKGKVRVREGADWKWRCSERSQQKSLKI